MTRVAPLLLAAALAFPPAAPAQRPPGATGDQTVWGGMDAAPRGAPVDSISPQDLLIVLDSMDIEARLTAVPDTDDTRAHPLGVTANTEGLYWDAVFYNCAGDAEPVSAESVEGLAQTPLIDLRPGKGCRDFALSAAFDLEFPVSVQTVNRFNREYRFARASLSEDGAPTLQMDVNLEGGISRSALEVEIEAWRALLLSFSRYVGY